LTAFEPYPGLANAHAQTMFAAFGRRPPRVVWRPERFELSDGDFVDLCHLGPREGRRVVVLHGLGGSAESPYVRGMASAIAGAGWAVTAFQFRGASGALNRRPRLYHSGDTGDIAEVARALRPSAEPLIAVGFSLGGNVTLKLLGEQGADSVFDAGVGISVPFQLDVCADVLARGVAWAYGRFLVHALQRIVWHKRAQLGSRIDVAAAMRARDFRTFDGLVTAPLAGFASAADYYTRCSSRAFVGRIARPTLVIHALDDPFMRPGCVPEPHELAPSVTLEASPHGGHVGFAARGERACPAWYAERRVLRWLAERYD